MNEKNNLKFYESYLPEIKVDLAAQYPEISPAIQGSEVKIDLTQKLPELNQAIEMPEIKVDMRERVAPKNLGNWNWGAFAFSGIWGLFNKIYWPFLVGCILSVAMIVSLVIGQAALYAILLCACLIYGFIISIYLGVLGNREAWSEYEGTADQFEKKQKGWKIAGLIAIGIAVLNLLIMFGALLF